MENECDNNEQLSLQSIDKLKWHYPKRIDFVASLFHLLLFKIY